MKRTTKLLAIIILSLITHFSYGQGVTTSSINGKALDKDNNPLPGASVVAIHMPSGTKYGTATDFDGLFRISNMRVGGPYTITISFIGFNDFVRNNVVLQLGQTFRVNANLSETSNALEEVIITAQSTSVFDGNKTGSETTIDSRQINNLPTTSRSIADFVRITPQAAISEGNDGFSINIAGQNNRFNTIFVDGAVNNDQFGLAGSGTNGGQTGASPFSLDAIEQFNVSVAPFDVKLSGFTGGAINAVTKSGSNQFKGTVYGFLRNQNLAGKTPVDDVPQGGTRQKLAEFSSKTYGLSLGGPIVKDKVFFFVNYEKEENESPAPFNVQNYVGNSTQVDLDGLRNDVLNRFGYDIGTFNNNTTLLENDKITAKLDFNLSDAHKLTLSYRYTDIFNIEARNSDNNDIGFVNGSESFLSTTNSGTLEWNWAINNKMSNNLIFGYTSVRDNRDPVGNPFPFVEIEDGLGDIAFGSERFSTANLLNQDVFTVTDNFEIYAGKHTITLGTHNEFSSTKNLFFASNFGFYTFSSLDDFLNDALPEEYQRGYSLLSAGAGDNSSGAAEFDLAQYGFYIQDEVQLSDNFRLSAGVRFDLPVWEDGLANDDFNERTIPLLEAAGKDLQGAKAGQGISSIVHVAPRVGFNWNVGGNYRTQIRGGFGVFTSRIPLVWPGGLYNNNGITGGFLFDGSPDFNFSSDINNQPVGAVPGTGQTGGNVDLFAPGTKLPQILKYNIAFDQKLPWLGGLVLNAEFLYQNNIQTIYYENLNIDRPQGTLNGADNRPFYSDSGSRRVDGSYGRIILGSNTKEGESWNATIGLTKPFSKGFSGNITYTYGDSRSIFDLTSSQNSSQWRSQQTVNGKNSALPVTRSDFAVGSRITSWASYEFEWFKNFKSTISLFYEGRQGNLISYIYDDLGGDLLDDDSRDNALIYIPRNESEINLVDLLDNDGNLIINAQDQWDQLNTFIEGNDYLRKRRGKYAERNGDRNDAWSHVVDLRFAQDLIVDFGNTKNTLQFTLDIFNFTNMLNKDWGVRKFVPSNEIELIQTQSTGPDPTFSFNPRVLTNLEDIDDVGIQSSRWQMRLGLRYIFN